VGREERETETRGEEVVEGEWGGEGEEEGTREMVDSSVATACVCVEVLLELAVGVDVRGQFAVEVTSWPHVATVALAGATHAGVLGECRGVLHQEKPVLPEAARQSKQVP